MSDYFPEEVTHEILLRLPVKSLIKCSTVCQSWRSLIKSSAFIDTHLSLKLQSNNHNDNAHLLLLKGVTKEVQELYSLHNPAIGESTMLIQRTFFTCCPRRHALSSP
ncbi:hypothetical protein M0R45_015201 [Rubus argutus]|uniref:F-box domain-containing protein n=1 Tax=Rubus argutus TaxID=59490 RepID=A0AAW1XNY7_RUBAR